jgi:hypothetical protein
MGGAVAMNMTVDTPQVLIAPAWRIWFLLRFGETRRVKPSTVIVHGDQDRTVFPHYSRQLLVYSQPAESDADVVAAVERGLKERLGDKVGLYNVTGRLVLVGGEGHRCNSEVALAAVLAGVAVLTEAKPGVS